MEEGAASRGGDGVRHVVTVDDDPADPADYYRARCSCSWVAVHARGLRSAAHRDALRHIGQQEFPDQPAVLPIF